MIGMTLSEVAAVTGGELHGTSGDPQVTSVEFDSRKAGPGALFLALPGERADGHDFAAAAVAQGAVATLAARPVDGPSVVVPPAARAEGTYLADADPDGHGAAVLSALGKLSRYSLDALSEPAERRSTPPGLTVVGVTGSAGKTSTKDLLAAVLAPLGPTVAPPESFNNELGTPWTALRADASTRQLVLEFSARGPGHIAALCAVAPPRIGVVLNVGSAHLGEFGSREGIAKAKGELVEALPPDGIAVLNADDPLVAAMASRTAARVVTFGTGGDVSARDVVLDAGRARFTLRAAHGEAPVTLQLVGAHQVSNALAAAAVALELGASVGTVADTLSAATPASRWRMEVTDRADGVTVVNDAYNANPEAMRAALGALESIAAAGRRAWAVLGPMAEIGDGGADAHAEIAALARDDGARLVAVGSPDYGGRAEHVADVPAALELLRAELEPGDVVLVKASRSAGLERVAAGLLEGNR